MCFSLLSVSCPGSGSLPRIVFLNVAKPWSPGIQTPLATRARRSSGVLCVDCTFPSFSEVAREHSDLQRMDGQPLGLKAAWAIPTPSLLFKSNMRSAWQFYRIFPPSQGSLVFVWDICYTWPLGLQVPFLCNNILLSFWGITSQSFQTVLARLSAKVLYPFVADVWALSPSSAGQSLCRAYALLWHLSFPGHAFAALSFVRSTMSFQ